MDRTRMRMKMWMSYSPVVYETEFSKESQCYRCDGLFTWHDIISIYLYIIYLFFILYPFATLTSRPELICLCSKPTGLQIVWCNTA